MGADPLKSALYKVKLPSVGVFLPPTDGYSVKRFVKQDFSGRHSGARLL